MWDREAKQRVAGLLARVLARYANADHLSGALAKLEHARRLFDEAAGAFWHFTAMPSKRDIRQLQRRVSALKERVRELDLIVAKLEAEKREARRDRATERPRPGGS